MTTYATTNWYERDGKRTYTKNGRSGIAEAMQTSPADDTTPPEVIHWSETIRQLQVATGPAGGRFSVLRSKPLNVKMKGQGKGFSLSILRSLEVGEAFADGSTNRRRPAVHRLVWTDLLIDVSNAGSPYPIVTHVDTALGTFGVRRALVRSGGVSHVVKTALRGNASGRYVMRGIDAPDGLQEYVVYINAGAGHSVVGEVEGRGCGRGVVQAVYRSTENDFYTVEPDDGTSLTIEDTTAINCGSAGSSAISITGWSDHIVVRGLDVDTPWNTAGISLRYDKKQAELDKPWSPKTANVIGPGKMLGTGYAHGTVVLDLEDSVIRTGTAVGGSSAKSSRPAIMVDSCSDLWVVSNEATRVRAGAGTNRALHVEHNGAGVIRTVDGDRIGTRAVEEFSTVGQFGGWGPMARAGAVISADTYLSRRPGR